MSLDSGALDTSLGGSHLLAIISDGLLGDGQQRSQLRLRYQVALGSQNKPPEFIELGISHVGESSTCRFDDQFRIAHCGRDCSAGVEDGPPDTEYGGAQPPNCPRESAASREALTG